MNEITGSTTPATTPLSLTGLSALQVEELAKKPFPAITGKALRFAHAVIEQNFVRIGEAYKRIYRSSAKNPTSCAHDLMYNQPEIVEYLNIYKARLWANSLTSSSEVISLLLDIARDKEVRASAKVQALNTLRKILMPMPTLNVNATDGQMDINLVITSGSQQ